MNQEIIKECPRHGETVFYYDNHSNIYRCKECRKEAVSSKRRRNKLALIEYKGGKCQICGYDKCVDALEFHHINKEEKEFGLGNGDIRSLIKLKEEADKCILVCANCHREIHAKEAAEKRKIMEAKEKEAMCNYIARHKSYTNNAISHAKINEINWKEIQKKINDGATLKQISNELALSENTIRRTLKKKNLPYTVKNGQKLKKYTVENLKKDLTELHNFSAIGRKYDTSSNAIVKFCIRNHIPFRLKELIEYFKIH